MFEYTVMGGFAPPVLLVVINRKGPKLLVFESAAEALSGPICAEPKPPQGNPTPLKLATPTVSVFKFQICAPGKICVFVPPNQYWS